MENTNDILTSSLKLMGLRKHWQHDAKTLKTISWECFSYDICKFILWRDKLRLEWIVYHSNHA